MTLSAQGHTWGGDPGPAASEYAPTPGGWELTHTRSFCAAPGQAVSADFQSSNRAPRCSPQPRTLPHSPPHEPADCIKLTFHLTQETRLTDGTLKSLCLPTPTLWSWGREQTPQNLEVYSSAGHSQKWRRSFHTVKTINTLAE